MAGDIPIATGNSHQRSTVYQLRATVNAPNGLEDAWIRVVDLLLHHINNVLYCALPNEAKLYQSFEVSSPKGKCECIAVRNRLLWAVRCHYTAHKTKIEWLYDVSMIQADDELLFGIKINTFSPITLYEAQKQISIINEIRTKVGLNQCRPISNMSWRIENDSEIDELYDMVISPSRSLQLILITEVNRNLWSFTPTAPDFLVNDNYLASRVDGYAHVVRIPFHKLRLWSMRVGSVGQVYDGACRIFFPKVNFEEDPPDKYPFNLKGAIWHWKYDNESGTKAYTSFLIDKAHQSIATTRLDWDGLYFLENARFVALEIDEANAKHVANAPERERVLQQRIDALQRKLETVQAESDQWLEELDLIQEANDFYREQNAALRHENQALRDHLFRQKPGFGSKEQVTIPHSFDEMADWVRQNLAGRLILLPRAERAIGKAEYENPELAYRGLLILANEYRNKRIGIGTEQDLQNALAEYKLELTPSISKVQAGIEGDTYYVKYPPGSNNQVMLDLHLTRGNSREPKYCLRIYFFWDKETQQVVVGSLPGHLDIRST